MNQHLINLVLALTAGELFHNLIEAQEVRKKVAWLRLSIAGKKYKDNLPFQIDTRAKSYALSLFGLIVVTAIFYVIFNILSLSLHTALVTLVVMLLLAYVVIAFLLDKYHVEIAVVTKPFKK